MPRKSQQLLLVSVVVAAQAALSAVPVSADPITFAFDGVVGAVPGPIPAFGPLSAGDRVSGFVTFELDSPDLATDPETGHYQPPGGFIHITFPDRSVTFADEFVVRVEDLNARTTRNVPFDRVFMHALVFSQSIEAGLDFTGPLGQDIIDLGEAIPTAEATYAAFPFRTLTLGYFGASPIVQVPVSLDSLRVVPTPNPVPEPITLVLVSTGAAGMLLRKRRSTSPLWSPSRRV